MGVNRAPVWGTLTGKPTTVAGLGLSDFNEQAIAAQAGAAVGGVGTYALLSPATNVAYAVGAVPAGSVLRYTGASRTDNSINLLVASVNATAPAGTWRCMGIVSEGGGNSLHAQIASVFLRIA